MSTELFWQVWILHVSSIAAILVVGTVCFTHLRHTYEMAKHLPPHLKLVVMIIILVSILVMVGMDWWKAGREIDDLAAMPDRPRFAKAPLTEKGTETIKVLIVDPYYEADRKRRIARNWLRQALSAWMVRLKAKRTLELWMDGIMTRTFARVFQPLLKLQLWATSMRDACCCCCPSLQIAEF